MNRKTFILKTFGFMLVGLPILGSVACSSNSDDNSNNPDPDDDTIAEPNCSANGAMASSISANHGHSLTVSRLDIDEAVEKSYSIQGISGHDHMITISASDFQTLQSDESITLVSTSGDGHSHSVIVSCA